MDKKNCVKNSYLDNVISNFNHLGELEESAEDDLKKVENLQYWQPSRYEKVYLPNLRLASFQPDTKITLLNKADLHIHTQWSDGDKLEKVLEAAERLELDAIAITDHDEIEGAIEARRIVHKKRLKFAVVPGIEVTSKDGHIGGLFVTKKIPEGLSAAETVELIHKAGGIAVAHHPYAPPIIDKILRVKLGCGNLIKKVPFDAIECTNAVPGYGQKYNIEACDAIRKNNIHISVTGSSDAHYAGFVGKGKTYYSGNFGVQSLYDNLKLGLTQGTESYWKTREKLYYKFLLAKGIICNFFQKNESVN